MVTAPFYRAGGAAGHKDLGNLVGGTAAERQIFEGINRDGGNVAPVFHRQRRASALGGEAAIREIVCELISEDFEGQLVEIVV